MGNRLTKSDSVTGNQTCAYDDAHIMLTGVNGQTYTNDANGNTLTGGGHTTDWLLDNGMMLSERRDGAASATYLVGGRGPEYRRDETANDPLNGNLKGLPSWYVYDGLGSVIAEVRVGDPAHLDTLNILATRKYDAYGSVRGSVGTGSSKQGFVGSLGHTTDDETGLVYMRARYMDATMGRFISEDAGREGTNWFVYCSNSPVSRCDVQGTYDDPIFLAKGFIWDTIRDCSSFFLFGLARLLEAASKINMARANESFQAALRMEAAAIGAEGTDTFGLVSTELEEMSGFFMEEACQSEAKGVAQLVLARQLRVLGYMMMSDEDTGGL